MFNCKLQWTVSMPTNLNAGRTQHWENYDKHPYYKKRTNRSFTSYDLEKDGKLAVQRALWMGELSFSWLIKMASDFYVHISVQMKEHLIIHKDFSPSCWVMYQLDWTLSDTLSEGVLLFLREQLTQCIYQPHY